MTPLWTLVVISSGMIMLDNYYFYDYHRCLKAKSKLEMVGELHYRKDAKCIRKEQYDKDTGKDKDS